jgi:hypothetical protein
MFDTAKVAEEIVHQASGHNKERLTSRNAPGSAPSWPAVLHADIVLNPPGPTQWTVQDLIEADSGPVLLYGQPACYKSFLTMHICHCIATGTAVFGKFPVPKPKEVAFLNLDSGQKSVYRRLCLFSPQENWSIVHAESFDIWRFEALLRDRPGAFVCIDCFANSYVPDPRQEQGADMRQFVQRLRRLYEDYGSTGIIIDHARRPRLGDTDRSQFYGSIQKQAVFRQMWQVKRIDVPDHKPGTARVQICCEKMSEAEPFDNLVLDLDWTATSFSVTHVSEAEAKADVVASACRAVLSVLAASKDGMSRKDLMKDTGYSKDVVLAAVRQPGIAKIGAGKNTRYTLKAPSDERSAMTDGPYIEQ